MKFATYMMVHNMKLYAIVAFLAVAHYSQPFAFACQYNLTHTLNDPTPTQVDGSGDLFGYSVASDGHYVLAGARQDDTNGVNVGQAHLFEASTGQLLRTFDDPTISTSDFFGHAIAVGGNRVLVGAPGDDTYGKDVGQAHLFNTLTGSLLFTLDDPTPNPQGEFGFSVALQNYRALVGAPNGNPDGLSLGQAYLFDTTNGKLLNTFDDPTPPSINTRGGSFGRSVAQFGDKLVVGEPGRIGFDSGTAGDGEVHVFDAVSGELLQTIDDPTPTTDSIFGDQFANSVAISSSLILVGDRGDNTTGKNVGQAHVFDLSTGNLIATLNDPSITGGDRFGTSVAINGNLGLIGASDDNSEGSRVGQAYLFDLLSGSLIRTFDDPTVTSEDGYGFSVGFAADQILVGAYRDNTHGESIGQVHLYTLVPEPSSLLLLAMASLVFLSSRRRV